mmetsp:Transcript_39980/g.125109  ORF Transcript_39980/g.125109 Transcript_39980/m.125109 type:complete len:225 (+) Transcript_39980:515-1189(+)
MPRRLLLALVALVLALVVLELIVMVLPCEGRGRRCRALFRVFRRCSGSLWRSRRTAAFSYCRIFCWRLRMSASVFGSLKPHSSICFCFFSFTAAWRLARFSLALVPRASADATPLASSAALWREARASASSLASSIGAGVSNTSTDPATPESSTDTKSLPSSIAMKLASTCSAWSQPPVRICPIPLARFSNFCWSFGSSVKLPPAPSPPPTSDSPRSSKPSMRA